MSRLCEEFGCLPSEALREVARAPVGLLETIIEFRAYAGVKAAYDRAKTAQDIPDHPLVEDLREIEFMIAQQDLDDARRTDH